MKNYSSKFKILTISFFIFLGLFYFAQSYNLAEAKNLYVSNPVSSACSDATTYVNNNVSSPWCTIGRAAWGSTNPLATNPAQAAQAGDTVLVSAGVYATNCYIQGVCTGDGNCPGGGRYTPCLKPVNSGTSESARITFTGVGTVDLRANEGQCGPVIGSLNNNYVTWQNFYIDESNLHTCSDTGPVVAWGSNYTNLLSLTIKAHQLFGGNHRGIGIEASNNTTVRNSKIYDVGAPGNYGQNEAGIMTYDSNYTLIENNEIYNCGSGIFIKGAHPESTQANTTIRKNLFWDINGYAIQLASSDTSNVYQNIVRDSSACFEYWNVASDLRHRNNKIVNNTCVRQMPDHAGNPTSGVIGWRISDANQLSGNIIQNNIFSDVDRIYWSWTLGTPPIITSEHNLYYDYTAARFWAPESGTSLSFAEWKTTTGGDSITPVSSVSNPLFVNSITNDFKLQANSPALTLGVDILDLDNDGSTTDIIPAGAYITGNETIGITSGAVIPPTDTTPPVAPQGLRVQ